MMIMMIFLQLKSKAEFIRTREYLQSKRILVRYDGVRAADEFLCVETDCRLSLN